MAKKEEKAIKEKNKENKVKKHFFKDFKAELKKVVWPTRSDVVSSVKVVLISTIIVAVVLGLLDLLFVTGMNLVF